MDALGRQLHHLFSSLYGRANHTGTVQRFRGPNGRFDRTGILILYGIATLVYGLLADRLGLHRVMFASLAAFAALTALTATAASIALWRVLTGLGASGVVPLALVLVGSLFPY